GVEQEQRGPERCDRPGDPEQAALESVEARITEGRERQQREPNARNGIGQEGEQLRHRERQRLRGRELRNAAAERRREPLNREPAIRDPPELTVEQLREEIAVVGAEIPVLVREERREDPVVETDPGDPGEEGKVPLSADRRSSRRHHRPCYRVGGRAGRVEVLREGSRARAPQRPRPPPPPPKPPPPIPPPPIPPPPHPT